MRSPGVDDAARGHDKQVLARLDSVNLAGQVLGLEKLRGGEGEEEGRIQCEVVNREKAIAREGGGKVSER